MNTRERLVEAAIEVIEAEGESGVRVDAVAERAGFTKPVLYYHFASRQDLIDAAQAERFRRSVAVGYEKTAAMIAEAVTPEEFLAGMRELMAMWASEAGAERRRFRINVLGSAVSRPSLMVQVVEAGRALADQIEEPLRSATERGLIRPDVPGRDFAQWWIGLVLGRIVFEVDPESFDTDNWDLLTDRVLRHMILGEDGSGEPEK